MKKKILIVEDSLDLIYFLRSQVQNLGYDSMLATQGKQAVDMAAAELPDLIILDILLPDMDGLAAARLIRENPKTYSIPILATTARGYLKNKRECLQNGCNDYIAKPFKTKELVSRIEKLLKKSSGNLSTLSP